MTLSVIIPAYKAERYVERAVRSALEQPQVTEIVLIEDGSPDGTLAACQRAAALDSRIRLLRHPDGGNRGAATTRNRGLDEARGELIAFLDADDYYLPGRFTVALELLRDPAVDGVYEAIGTGFESQAAADKFLSRRKETLTEDERRLTTVRKHTTPETLFEDLLIGRAGFCHLDGLTLRRSLVQRVGPFHPELRLHQDFHWLIRLAYHGRLRPGRLEEGVAIRWVHDNNRITEATREVSRPYRDVLFKDLMDWGIRVDLPGRQYRGLLRRFVTEEAPLERVLPEWLWRHLAIRRVVIAARLWLQLMRWPRLFARALWKSALDLAYRDRRRATVVSG